MPGVATDLLKSVGGWSTATVISNCLVPLPSPAPPVSTLRSKTPFRSAFKGRENPVLQFRVGPLAAGKPPLVPYA